MHFLERVSIAQDDGGVISKPSGLWFYFGKKTKEPQPWGKPVQNVREVFTETFSAAWCKIHLLQWVNPLKHLMHSYMLWLGESLVTQQIQVTHVTNISLATAHQVPPRAPISTSLSWLFSQLALHLHFTVHTAVQSWGHMFLSNT